MKLAPFSEGNRENGKFLAELRAGDLFSWRNAYGGSRSEFADLYLVLEIGRQSDGVKNKNAILVFLLYSRRPLQAPRRGWFLMRPACHGTFKLLSR